MRLRLELQMLTCLMVLVCCARPAAAHDPSLSGIRIIYRRADVVVNVTTHISRLLRAEGKAGGVMSPFEMDRAVRRRLHVRLDGRDLKPQTANVIADNANDLLTWQTVVPGTVRQWEVLGRLYPEDRGSRTVVSVVRDGQSIEETFLDDQHPDLLRSQPPPHRGAVALRYIREGILHIFGGPDHILFVLGLLLLGGTLRSLLKTITAFTLAHSITLSLAATGVFSPSPRIIEPLIALSIVAIAVENLRQERGLAKRAASSAASDAAAKPQKDLRPYYAFGFGLIHGFGFAGALAEVGLPRAALGVALASFNVGVEIGQASIVLAVSPLLALLARKNPRAFRALGIIGAIVIGVAGSYWFVTRAFPGLAR